MLTFGIIAQKMHLQLTSSLSEVLIQIWICKVFKLSSLTNTSATWKSKITWLSVDSCASEVVFRESSANITFALEYKLLTEVKRLVLFFYEAIHTTHDHINTGNACV